MPNVAGTHRNKIKKSSSQFKKSVSNLYARPPTTVATSSNPSIAITSPVNVVATNVNGATYLEAKGQKNFKSHPHQRHQRRNSDAANMDFLITQVPATTTNDARRKQELRGSSNNNAGVLLLNGINNNLNVKQQLMHHQHLQQQQQHLHHQKMTKKKSKLAQTQLDKLTQINIHLHGMYFILIVFALLFIFYFSLTFVRLCVPSLLLLLSVGFIFCSYFTMVEAPFSFMRHSLLTAHSFKHQQHQEK